MVNCHFSMQVLVLRHTVYVANITIVYRNCKVHIMTLINIYNEYFMGQGNLD